ncbi:KLHL10 [Cordylochernes scorpioides]|uniref:KLHL10 n=1 Tax=Cordylochernes scorpioides TaxID=51811 RepID=A0ABY6KPF6_9ARAC|nr:KLHL10 [Cordylochernes scorpioides]
MFRLAASKPSYEPGSPHSTGALAERRFSQQTMDCLYHLRSEGIACDGILRTQDGGEFHVHRPIMVACSTYFKALYTSPLNTDDRRDVTLPGVAAAMLRHIVDYAYTHKATIHWGNVHDLFQAADQFNVIDMVQDCVNFLVANMDPKNCIGIMKFARLFSCPPLKNAAYNYLMSNFVEVAQNSQELYKLTVGEMVDILSAEDLNVKNEEIVWETALKWIAKDPASRSRYIVALMRCVRLGLLDSQYFIEEVKNHPYVVDNQACRPLVIETLKHLYDLEITTHRDGDVLIPEIARPRMPHDVLFVMGGWSGGSATSLIETYDCRTDRWMKKHFDRSHPTKEGRLQLPESDPTGPRAYHKCAVIDFDIFVIGGFDGMGYFNSCRRFNTLTKEWREIAPMYVRRSIGLDILPQAISTQVEKTSVDSSCTAARRHHMCQVARCRRCYVSVAVLDRVIYAMGGYDGQRRQNTAEKYDYKTNQILLDDPRSTEAQINDEMELCETYSLQVGIVAQKVKEYESKLAAPCDDKMSQSSTSDVKRQIKLPKFELKKYTDESLSDVDKFEYLIQSMVVGSKAHRLVTSFPLTQKNYNKVIGDLKDRFGDRDMLTELYVRKLLKLVIASARSEKRTLAQLYDDLVAHLHSLGSLGVDTKSGGGAFLYPLVESSLPLELIKIWQRSRTPFKERDYSEIEEGIEHSGAEAFDKLEGLIEFLKQEVKNAERISFVAEGFEPSLPLKQGKRENNPPKIHTASALFVGKTNLPCLFCDKDNHLSQNCFKAAKMLESDRLKRVQDAKVCFKCLRKNHLKKDCGSFVRCKRCQGPHFEIMCRGTSHSQESLNWRSDNRSHNSLAEQNEGNSEPVTAMANQVCTNNISLMTLIVKIKGPKRSKMVRVLLDSGSQKSYIRRSLAKELDLPKVGEVKLNKFLFGGQTTGEKAHSIFYFQLDNVDEGKAFKMEALEETIICGNISPVETGPRQWELDKKGITLTKVDNNKTEIDILIGGDYYGQLLTGKIEQLAGGLTAIQTVLGWTLIGNTSSERPETSAQMVITLLTTQQRVASLWELETIGIRDPTEVIPVKEKNVLMQEKFREKICRGHDGHYLLSLPWKEGIGTIPNNLEIAKRRLEAMTQKLTQKGQFVPYDEVFRSWFRENLIEEVDREDIRPTGHYLPHRPIYKVQSQTTPIRPVYDASCKASKRSLSLNECLETGPNLIELLPEILIRLREKKIGAIADIRKAFQTVGIDEKERFHKEYLAMLVQKRNETEGRRFLPGEVVLIGRDDQKRIFWPLGRILELYPGKDGRERVARVRTATGEFVRPLKRLFPLELGSDISREVRLPKTEGIKAQEIPTDGEQSIFTRSGRERPGVVTQWLMIASMHSPRSDASATSLNGQVFITGGFDGSICMNSVESYNPATNQWTNVTPMRSRRSGVSCINYHDQLYVLGGFNGISRLCSGERYNPKTDTWTYIPDMSISRSNFAMAIIDEMIFVIGGFDGVTTIYNVESYSDKTNTWTDMTRMNIFRSALAACVVPELPNVRDYVPGDRDQSLKEKRMKVLQVQTPPYGPELLGIRSR